jgi:hypothetical protein
MPVPRDPRMTTSPHMELAERLAERFIALAMVEAVAVAGSRGAGASPDAASDVDLYVYTRGQVPLDIRAAIIEASGGATRLDLGQDYWGPSDGWIAAGSGIEIDVVYFGADWMEAELDRVLVRHEPSLGYTTCLWHTVARSLPIRDPRGWFAALQARAQVPYPEALRRRIVEHNHPALRGIITGLANQITKAAARGDVVSVNHRLAALLACYFDILFAANRVTHPGEKRLLELAAARCERLPQGMAADVTDLVTTAAADPYGVSIKLGRLLDHLDAFLVAEDLLAPADTTWRTGPAHAAADAREGPTAS